MTAQPGKYQANFNGGEYAPELHGRVDLKQYYAGAAYMRNVEPVPQGGFKLMPRTAHAGFVRNLLQPLGSTFATTLGPHTTAAVLATATLSSAQPVAVARLTGLGASQAIAGLIRVEYLDPADLTYKPLGPVSDFSAGITARNRVAGRPPGHQIVTTQIRVRLTGAPPSSTTFTLDGLALFGESAVLPPVCVVRPFTFARDQAYEFVFINSHIDIWRDDTFVGCCTTSYNGDTLRELDLQQRFDTMLIFHNDFAPARLLRDGADHEWDLAAQAFTGMPQVDYGGAYVQVIDEWQFTLAFPTDLVPHRYGINLLVAFNVNGEEVAAVSTGDDGGGLINGAAFFPALETAIEATSSVAPGIAVSVVDYTPAAGYGTFKVAFDGVDNAGAAFSVSGRVVNTASASVTFAHTVIGDAGGEDVMSVARGWPGCGLFWQDRLGMAGFEAKKAAILFSRTGEYFDLDITVANAAAALLANLDTDGAERIVRLARSLHLILFTTGAEYFIVDRALSRTQNPNVVECSRNGIVPTIPVCKAEDTLFYVAADKEDDDGKGVLVYAMQYSDAAQRYISEPISLLASHIAQDVVDAAMQVFSRPTAASRYYLVREDGAMTVGLMIRGQDVTGFARWITDGAVRSACVNGKNVGYVVVERQMGGVPRLMFERLTDEVFLDGAVTVTNATPSATVTGLDMHNGAQVWAVADGYVLGPFTPAGGAITLPDAATTITVGRWTPPRALTLPVPRIVQDTTMLARPVRVHTVRGNVIGTTSLAIGANDQAPEDVPFARAGLTADVPLPPFSGAFECGGLTEFTETGTVEITQLRPGPLQIRDLIVEARV
jgi:hypothetical protein